MQHAVHSVQHDINEMIEEPAIGWRAKVKRAKICSPEKFVMGELSDITCESADGGSPSHYLSNANEAAFFAFLCWRYLPRLACPWCSHEFVNVTNSHSRTIRN